MRCPKDDTDLIEIERQGIEIDYCPTCKGVWLDRRELDELINRSSATTATIGRDDDDDDRDDHRDTPLRPESRERSRGFMDRARDMIDDDHRDRDRSRRPDKYSDRDDDDHRSRGKKKKSKRGMLEDLFDF